VNTFFLTKASLTCLLLVMYGCGTTAQESTRNPAPVGLSQAIDSHAQLRSHTSGLRSTFCPPLAPGHAANKIEVIKSGNVQELLQQLHTASPNTTLLLKDGIYALATNQSLEVRTPRVTISSASGNREAVIIEGGHNNISINADDVTIADITLRNSRFHNIQVRGERGIARTTIYNVHLADAGQQFVKVSAGDGTQGKFADGGLVACSLIEYTTYARGTDVTPPAYTNGVDVLAGKGWVIRDNTFRRIRSQAGPAGPAILVWKNAMDTTIQRNLIVDCWRGIALGLSTPNTLSRGGAAIQYDHQNGLVENNVILALHEPADAAIENNFALHSRVLHNTVYYNKAIKHTVDWAIEYRFPPTTVVIQNNLTNLRILKRPPYPHQEARVEGNVTHAAPAWFHDVTGEDIHLVEAAPAIDAGVSVPDATDDIDGDTRPAGAAPDAGADEFVPPSVFHKAVSPTSHSLF
jgi:hypothetical protein